VGAIIIVAILSRIAVAQVAPPLCGAVVDGATRAAVPGAMVDCAGGDISLRGCLTLTDSLGLYWVGGCEGIVVFSAAGYDTLRLDWVKFVKDCESREKEALDPRAPNNCEGIELRDAELVRSEAQPLKK